VKIVHVITGLDSGGTQHVLRDLCRAHVRTGVDVRVISLTTLGSVGVEMSASGISVRELGLGSPALNPLPLLRVGAWLRRERADIIHTWMYHANLLGGIAARLTSRVPVVWGLHHVLGTDTSDLKPATLRIARSGARLSALIPNRIVCCGAAVMDSHVRNGYAADRMLWIPNGVDVARFRPDPAARASIRSELGLDLATPLIGLFARYHPVKDHGTFFRAASILHKKDSSVHFVLCGDGVDSANADISAKLAISGLTRHVHLLGLRSDLPRLYAALDLASLSSRSEAFPLVVCEAMASAVPCVTTNVGDCAHIIADTGRVVPAGDAEALAAAWLEMLRLGRVPASSLGQRARARISAEFNAETTSHRYFELYDELMSARPE
jgi:glycosyltransferase involved in cell wall biosynthesis